MSGSGDRPEYTPEEQAHCAPDGPVSAAWEWLQTVITQRDLAGAWWRTDDTLRLCIAQGWLWGNRRHPAFRDLPLEEEAVRLAGLDGASPLWQDFAGEVVDDLLLTFSNLGVDFTTWSLEAYAAFLSVGLERVDLVHCRPGAVCQGDEERVPFIMRLCDGVWFMAALSDELPIPGWPPSTSSESTVGELLSRHGDPAEQDP